MHFLAEKGGAGVLVGCLWIHMTSEGFGEMFEGDFSDTYAKEFSLMSMWGQANMLKMNSTKILKNPHYQLM